MPGPQPLQVGMEPYPGCRLRQLLGRGGFAEVWEADADNGTQLALKFMPCQNSTSPGREVRSIQMIRELQHPHLVRIDQVWSSSDYLVIAMELAEGDLRDLLHAYQMEFQTPIPPEQVCIYLSQIADALDFLNTRQHPVDGRLVAIQHCDVKPSNMLLFGDTVKLSDFGLASVTTTHSRTHHREGTLDYAAPEVFQGLLSDRSDQYALAVSYYELRTGRMPFPEINAFRQSWPGRRPPPDLSVLTPAERPIIEKALKTIPQNRWPSCAALMEELTKAVMG
ncbi:MAG: serine/threonine-protein kinase [Gemmataceae bacterium]